MSNARDIEIEGECIVGFTVEVQGFGRYSKVEHDIARTLAHSLHRNLGAGRYVLRDEAGRRVIFNNSASFGSEEQVLIVEKPT